MVSVAGPKLLDGRPLISPLDFSTSCSSEWARSSLNKDLSKSMKMKDSWYPSTLYRKDKRLFCNRCTENVRIGLALVVLQTPTCLFCVLDVDIVLWNAPSSKWDRIKSNPLRRELFIARRFYRPHTHILKWKNTPLFNRSNHTRLAADRMPYAYLHSVLRMSFNAPLASETTQVSVVLRMGFLINLMNSINSGIMSKLDFTASLGR